MVGADIMSQERIELLTSEVRRLRARLAAGSGDEDLYSFLLNNHDINSDYVEDLRSRYKYARILFLCYMY